MAPLGMHASKGDYTSSLLFSHRSCRVTASSLSSPPVGFPAKGISGRQHTERRSEQAARCRATASLFEHLTEQ